MIGAILGDMIGAPYEFDRSPKAKEFPLFSKHSEFTDDSVMTIAVAEALMDTMGQTDEEIKGVLVDSMQKWGRRYPDAGYPKQEAVAVALKAVSNWLSAHPDYGMSVIMVCYDVKMRECYQNVIDAAAAEGRK